MDNRNRLKFFTWRRMVLRFFYPVWVVMASKKKVDALNENSLRAAQATDGIITIFLHGIFTNYYSSPYWALRWLKSNGIQVVSLGYDYEEPVATAALQIKEQIDAILARTGIRKINIIGLSLGGCVARYYVEKLGGKEIVEKLVTVFSPVGSPGPHDFSVAYLMNKLVDAKKAAISKEQSDAIAHSFSAEKHLAIYGTADWIVGPHTYPLQNVPESVTQVPIAGGHLLVSYNSDALDIALGYLLDMPLSEVGVNIPTPLNLVMESPVPIIAQLVRSFESEAREKKVTLVATGLDEASVRFDRDSIKEILTNLIENAIKYNRPDGTVSVRAEIKRGQYAITVSDTGFGISAFDQKKLFRKFFRVRNHHTQMIPGTGLGLWVGTNLAERMGGTLTVESIEGVGSHFTLYLPVAEAA